RRIGAGHGVKQREGRLAGHVAALPDPRNCSAALVGALGFECKAIVLLSRVETPHALTALGAGGQRDQQQDEENRGKGWRLILREGIPTPMGARMDSCSSIGNSGASDVASAS